MLITVSMVLAKGSLYAFSARSLVISGDAISVASSAIAVASRTTNKPGLNASGGSKNPCLAGGRYKRCCLY